MVIKGHFRNFQRPKSCDTDPKTSLFAHFFHCYKFQDADFQTNNILLQKNEAKHCLPSTHRPTLAWQLPFFGLAEYVKKFRDINQNHIRLHRFPTTKRPPQEWSSLYDDYDCE